MPHFDRELTLQGAEGLGIDPAEYPNIRDVLKYTYTKRPSVVLHTPLHQINHQELSTKTMLLHITSVQKSTRL